VTNSGRRTLTGYAVGHGWVQGSVRCLADLSGSVPHQHLNAQQLTAEVQRFDQAVSGVGVQMQKVIDQLQVADSFMAEGGDVLAAHISIAEDPELRSRVVGVVNEAHINVAWALDRVLEDVETEFSTLSDPYIASRVLDIRQVFHRLQRELAGGQLEKPGIPSIDPTEVLVARDLEPAIAIEILRQRPAAVITEEGSATSHLALLCRALRVPAMVGVKGAAEFLVAGDQVLVDLEDGVLVRDPDRRDIALARVRSDAKGLNLADPELPAVSLDGTRVHLHANLDMADSIGDALSEGAEGIGLFRSEYLFLGDGPDLSDIQAETYQRLMSEVAGPVTIRTYDIGSDKLPLGTSWEPNPALGLRAVRGYQADPQLFRNQMRALMQVAVPGCRLRILLPMIDGLASWHWAADEVERIAAVADKRRGEDFMLGAMVELPSVLFVIEELAEQADFLSLGTNDLVQYLLAVDRQNPVLAKYAAVTHPAVLRGLARAVRAGRAASIPVSCCGEMAASPIGVMILVGLGVRELSMPPLDLALVRTLLRRTNAAVFKGLIEKALEMTESSAIDAMLRAHYHDWRSEQRR
jgi:phosphotransferase system enzyme I (PtsI)